jgi:MFS family permease
MLITLCRSSNVLGIHRAVIGLIDGVAETTASLLKVYTGALSDRLRARKWLAVTGYAISAAAKPFLYGANSWGWVLGVRFADRVGKGIRNPPRDALVAASTHPDQRGLAFGLHRAGDTLGAFIGIAVAAAVIWRCGGALEPPERHSGGSVAQHPPAVLAVIVLAAGAHEARTPAAPRQAPRPPLSGLDSRFKYFMAVVVLFTLGNSSDAFIVLRGQERGLSVLQVMGMLITFTLVYAVLSGPLGAFSDRLGRRRIILIGWFVYALVYFGLSQDGWQVGRSLPRMGSTTLPRKAS